MLPPSVQAENWPTKQFVAHEGTPNAGVFDDILPINPPLTPEIRADLKDYLNRVASYLEPEFPAPALQRTDHIEDGPGGPPANLVYYYDAGDDFGTAVYAFNPNCKAPDELYGFLFRQSLGLPILVSDEFLFCICAQDGS